MKNNYLLILLAILCFSACIEEKENEANGNSKIVPGNMLPSFTVVKMDGGTFSSESLKNKVTLLVFFDTTCGDCQRELPQIEQVWNDLKTNTSFTLITVSRGQNKETVKNYWTQSSFSMPVYLDENKVTYSLFAGITIPRFYLTDKSGTVRWIADTSLGITVEELKRKIENLLEE